MHCWQKAVIPRKLFNPVKRSAGADVYQDLFTPAPGTLKEKDDSGGAAGIKPLLSMRLSRNTGL